MKGNRDGQKPWSEDDLFDLDSALACGGDIYDIADFLSRDVAEVERASGVSHLLFRLGKYGFHSEGVTASGVPFPELTQPAAVSLNGLLTTYGSPWPSVTNSITSMSSEDVGSVPPWPPEPSCRLRRGCSDGPPA
jgi:hypothetical protein